jgi:outer membrane protein assembly factor BamB
MASSTIAHKQILKEMIMRYTCDAIVHNKVTRVLNFATVFVLSTLFLVPVCNAQSKPPAQFRNNPAHTGEADEKTLSSANISDLAIQWKGITKGAISSSPVVVLQPIDKGSHHVAYVASKDGYLYAFNADNCHLGGDPLISGQECPVVWKFFVGTNAITSPAVADELIAGTTTSVVYVVGGDGFLYAINAVTGQQIWKDGIGGPVAYSSPAVTNGRVYVLGGGLLGYLISVDAATGGGIWYGSITGGYASPAVANGMAFVGDIFGTFSAFNANGCGSSFCSPLWSSTGHGMFHSSAAVSNGLVYVGNDDGNLYVFNTSGSIMWTATLNSAIFSSPAVSNGVVYVTAGQPNSIIGTRLYAFDAAGVTNCLANKCQPLWSGALNGGSSSSAVVANGVVYLSSDDGNLYAFKAAGCGGSSNCSPIVTVASHGGSGSSPTVLDGYVYVGSWDGTLYLIGTCGYVCRYDNQSLY